MLLKRLSITLNVIGSYSASRAVAALVTPVVDIVLLLLAWRSGRIPSGDRHLRPAHPRRAMGPAHKPSPRALGGVSRRPTGGLPGRETWPTLDGPPQSDQPERTAPDR